MIDPYIITLAVRNNMLLGKVDGFDYAVINEVGHINEVDTADLTNWVLETCYEEDFKDSQYTPCYLDRFHFLPKETT